MKVYTILLLPTLLAAATVHAATPPKELFSPLVPQKVLATYNALPKPIQYPQYTTASGTWKFFSPNTWTSAFFPATLYALNTRKQLCGATSANALGIADWLALGRAASAGLVPLEQSNGVGHDVGFLSFPFGEELKVNPNNATAKTAINNFAKLLSNRYSSTVRATRSWDASDPTDFQVIIDNMMNLDVLYQSAQLTGNSTYRDIANAHATTTIKNHIRADGGTWHVIEYNSTTGNVINKRTAQGYSDSSTWSRGQAWGIYGFTNMYNLTGTDSYLQTARRLADYFLGHVPTGGVVPWDFQAPTPAPADSSAAMIAANGLLLLAKNDADNEDKWTNAAIDLVASMTELAWNTSWKSILANGTVNKPANNQLTGTVYGDYYLITAGNELIDRGLAECT